MTSRKNEIIATVARAKIELEQALDDLKSLPMNDPLVFGFISRALQNYLNISSATLTLLMRALRKYPDPQVFNWLEGLQLTNQRMAGLVDELKGSPGKATPALTLRKTDFPLLVRRACEFYQTVAARKEVQVVFDKSASNIPPIWTDRIAVAAIMDNLLSNAVKHSPTGGTISVYVEQREGSLVTSVRDEGVGLKPEHRLNLFQREPKPRSSADGSPEKDFGLVVAGDLIALLGGEIWYESTKGRGSCFSFRIPSGHRRKGSAIAPKLVAGKN